MEIRKNIKLYCGSRESLEYPGIRMGKYTKEFSWGFYCVFANTHAERCSTRNITPVVNEYMLSDLEGLKVKTFESLDLEWLKFVVKCRSGELHEYDVVEGPMVDDAINNYVDSYLNKEITAEAFLELIKFKHAINQISFHTIKALSKLKFKSSYIVKK